MSANQSDFTITGFVLRLREAIEQSIITQREQVRAHKFAAHERLFRMVLNISTLALTGWVGLASWKFEAFLASKTIVLTASGLFVLGMVLSTISDFLVMLQSRKMEFLTEHQGRDMFGIFTEVENHMATIRNSGINDDNVLRAESQKFLLEKLTETDKRHEPETKRVTRMGNWTWYVGISGVAVFFFAICFSVMAVPSFVDDARQLTLKSSSAPPSLTSPTEKDETCHRQNK